MVKLRRGEEARAYLVARNTWTGGKEYDRNAFLDAKTYYADEPRNAAKQAAAYDHHACGGHEWSWPATYIVEDASTGKRWSVEVERETVPEFSADKAVVVK